MKRHYIGMLAIALGIISLGLSVYLFDQKQELEEQKTSDVKIDTDFTFKFGEKEFSIGSKSRDEESQDFTEIEKREKEVRSLNISMISIASIAFILVPVSWIKEKNKTVSVVAAIFPVIAIAWQFIVIGIAAGVAIAILLVFLSALSGSI